MRNQTGGIALPVQRGLPPFVWSATGLPPGTSLDVSTGEITGTTTTPGVYTVSYTVRDQFGHVATSSLLWTVNVPIPNLVDMNVYQAIDAARTEGLRIAYPWLTRTTYVASDHGKVMQQQPSASSGVQPGTAITIRLWNYVNDGHEPQ